MSRTWANVPTVEQAPRWASSVHAIHRSAVYASATHSGPTDGHAWCAEDPLATDRFASTARTDGNPPSTATAPQTRFSGLPANGQHRSPGSMTHEGYVRDVERADQPSQTAPPVTRSGTTAGNRDASRGASVKDITMSGRMRTWSMVMTLCHRVASS
jgi:hypothetical protein